MPALTDDERAARRDADRQRMADAVNALTTSDGWQRWLRTRAAFRTYSIGNQLLIASQREGATRVAGFRAWLKLGYCVRKGERALYIWAPMPPSKKKLAEWRAAGSVPADKPRGGFKMTAVFDRSQVEPIEGADPAPLDSPCVPVDGDELAVHIGALRRLADDLGVTVDFDWFPNRAADGWFSPHHRSITINCAGPARNRHVQTLIHELAHAIMWIERPYQHRHEGDPPGVYIGCGVEEVIVEAVAFTVCAGLGVDTSSDSVPYVATWDGQAAETMEARAGLIHRVARRIEDALHTPAEQTAA